MQGGQKETTMYNDSFRARYGTAPIAIHSTVDFVPTYPHIHNEIELLYITEGYSKIKISDMYYDAQPGDLFVVNPMEVHSVMMEKGESYSHRCICFDCSLVVDNQLSSALLNGCKSAPHYFKRNEKITLRLVSLFEQLFQSVQQDSPALLFEASASISLFFAELIRHQLIQEHLPIDKQPYFSTEVLTFLEKYYCENVTSKIISEKLGYTQSYFCRIFKQNFGVPFSTYLSMYRILIAKEKLRDTSQSISAIATACGFRDIAYFTKCFKNSVGITPLKYRKSQSSHKK